MPEFSEGLSSVVVEKMIEEGYEDFLTISTTYSLAEVRKYGEILFYLLKIGLKPIDIDQLVGIRVTTIERRILNFLKEKEERGEETYDDYKFLFENVKGLPDIDIYRRFLYTKLKEEDFVKVELISKSGLRILKEKMNSKGMRRYVEELQRREIGKDKSSKSSARRPSKGKKRVSANYVLKLA